MTEKQTTTENKNSTYNPCYRRKKRKDEDPDIANCVRAFLTEQVGSEMKDYKFEDSCYSFTYETDKPNLPDGAELAIDVKEYIRKITGSHTYKGLSLEANKGVWVIEFIINCEQCTCCKEAGIPFNSGRLLEPEQVQASAWHKENL